MIPWSCDCLLDIDERHASAKFRRFRGFFSAEDIQYQEATELVAFLKAVPVCNARFIFEWGPTGVFEAKRLLKHLSDDSQVARMVEANDMAVEVDDGLRCLRAMREGGWTNGTTPPMVRMALLGLLDRGMSRPAIGRAVGLSVDQVRVAMGRPHWRRVAAERQAKAQSLLAV